MIRQRVAGAAALLAILGIVAGLPALLLTIGANPIPSAVPSLPDLLSRLFEPDDGSAVIWVFTMLAWIAWAFLAGSILLEIIARIRGLRAPRLPGLKLPQAAAKGLVGVAVLLFAATPLVASAQPAQSGPAQPQTSDPQAVQVVQRAGDLTHRGDQAHRGDGARPGSHDHNSKRRVHAVKDGESLWSIAEDRLGDGERFREIAELNYGRAQQDGEHLTRNHAITVGWKLRLPPRDEESSDEARRPARHQPADGERRTIKEGDTLWDIAEETLGSGERYPEIFKASRHIEQPGGYRITDPDEISEGWTVLIPADRKSHDPKTADKPDKTPNDRRQTDAQRPGAGQPGATGGDRKAGSASRPSQADPHGGERSQPVDRVESDRDTTPAQPAPSTQQTARPPAAASSPSAGAPAPGQAGSGPHTDTTSSDADAEQEEAFPIRTAAGVGTLVAAGVIGLVAARRRHQQRHRPHQARLPMPEPATAHTEQQLRAAADPLSVELVDAALRALARSCATSDQPLPRLRAARLTADQLDLYLDEEAELPEPWTGTVDTTVWTLSADQAVQLTTVPNDDSTPAPYPALVTIGHDADDGHVLLDLEHIGSLGLHGDPQATRQVLAALAIELATSHWADDLQVTLVGAYPDLEEALQTGRIRYVPTIGGVLDDLTRRAEVDRAALAEADAPDLHHARVTGTAPDAWPPDILLLAGPLTDSQRTQLAELLDTTPRLAIAAVTTDTVLGRWSLNDIVDGRETAVLEPIGLSLQPQRIDTENYAHILDMVAIASEPVDSIRPTDDTTESLARPIPLPTPTEADDPPVEPHHGAADTAIGDANELVDTADLVVSPEAATLSTVGSGAEGVVSVEAPGEPSRPGATSQPSADLNDGGISEEFSPSVHDPFERAAPQTVTALPRPRPTIRVLGPVDLQNATGTVEQSKRPRLLEYAAYLALHPEATHSSVDDAIWPNRTNQDNGNTRNTHTSKLRKWLGKNDQGDDYLIRFSYSYLDEVTCDWAEFQSHAGPDVARASTSDLEQALALVRGRPFDGVHPRRYAWAEILRQAMISGIVDVSYELAHRRLMDGRWRSAEEAVVVGINLEPGIERLWRLRILAAHEARNRHRELEAIDRLLVITDQLGSDLEPETEHLLSALQNPHYSFDELKQAL